MKSEKKYESGEHASTPDTNPEPEPKPEPEQHEQQRDTETLALQTQVQELTQMAIDSQFQLLATAGKITVEEREVFSQLATDKGVKYALSVYEKRPPVTPQGTIIMGTQQAIAQNADDERLTTIYTEMFTAQGHDPEQIPELVTQTITNLRKHQPEA